MGKSHYSQKPTAQNVSSRLADIWGRRWRFAEETVRLTILSSARVSVVRSMKRVMAILTATFSFIASHILLT